jgi:hypothetical protein
VDALQAAIGHGDNAIAKVVDPAVVSNYYDSSVGLHGHIADQCHRGAAAGCIQSGSRFIADEQARLVDERTSNRHPLLLTAR